MGSGQTNEGASKQAFPNTTWGLIAGLRNIDAPQHRTNLEALCRRYWGPIYHYVRAAWAKSKEDAEDLTQGFFLWLLEGEALSRYAAERASFRRYLKVLLAGFVGDQQKALSRLKRGGGMRIAPLAENDGMIEKTLADSGTATPEELFDKAWAMTVARRAIERVRARCRSEGHELRFRVYELYDLAGGAQPTYQALAERLGLTESDVRESLRLVRQAIRRELRAEVSDMVTDEEELRKEMDELFGY